MRGARGVLPDLVGAMLLVLVGAAFVYGALGFEVFGEGGRIGPGFMPFMAGGLVAAFGAMIGAETIRKSRRPEDTDGETEARDDEREGSTLMVGVVFAMTLGAILLTGLVGFLPAFGLLVFALVRFVEKGGVAVSVALGVGAVVTAWAVFVLFLGIPLPMGVFAP